MSEFNTRVNGVLGVGSSSTGGSSGSGGIGGSGGSGALGGRVNKDPSVRCSVSVSLSGASTHGSANVHRYGMSSAAISGSRT